MRSKMLLSVKLDQKLSMNQQLQQAIMLMHYNTVELKQLIRNYYEKNPLLELDESDDVQPTDDGQYQVSASVASPRLRNQSHFVKQDDDAIDNVAAQESLRAHLIQQTHLCQWDTAKQYAAEAIIDAIDDNGYLSMTLEEIQQTISHECICDQTTLAEIHATIMSFDPVGVGARDIKESLLVQLNNLSNHDLVWQTTVKLLNHYLDSTFFLHHDKLMKKLDVSEEIFEKSMTLLRSLNLNPASEFSSENNYILDPELVVKKMKEGWQVFLSDSILTKVSINREYQNIINKNKTNESYHVLKQELLEAKWLINSIKRRNETLLSVAQFIMRHQVDFLEMGKGGMKSLNIADVANALELHESTISRVTTGKFIATPHGVFELKFFFPSSVETDGGESTSAIAVKDLISHIISQESPQKVLSDEQIAQQLRQDGIHISRRTVAKYRESMKILPSYQRRVAKVL